MQKSSLEKLLKAEGHYAGDLVSLQFKSESLQQFLQNVVQIVNQHSRRINTLQIDKISKEQISKTHLDFANAAKVNPTVAKQLSIQNQDRIYSMDENSTGVCMNLVNHSKALSTLFQATKKMNQRIQNLSSVLDSFENKENVKQSIRKTINTAKKYTEDQCEKILTRLKELQMKTNKKISEFENTTRDVQKKTLWKINECQSTLLKKITPEYVDKALQQFQGKILNDISNNKNQQLNQLKFNNETLKSKLQMLSRNVQDYERQNKLLIKELTQDAKKFQSRDKIEHDKRDQDMRMKQLLIKIDRLEKRQDPQQLQIRILKSIDEHKEKIEAATEKLKKMDSDLSSLNNVLSTMGGSDGSGIDPHKLCHMDGQLRRLRDSNRTNELKVQSLEDQLKLKLLTFEQRIMTTLGLLKGQDNFVSREEMYESLARLRQPVMQKLGQNQNLIYQVNGKLSKLEMFEKVTKRKIKEMTRGDDLNKILDMKMNIGQADAQFNSVNMKMQNLQIILNKVRMEVDSSSQFLRILQQQMNEPQEGINIIGPKQKVFPAKCLGCGHKHIPSVHQNNMMQGTDGKYYKVDLKNSYLYDQKEVYGVTPSQIAIYESGVKKRITSATNRPTSSRTNLRPSSAKHF